MGLATAQVVVRDDPGDVGQLRQSGRDVRELMRQACSAGARIIHFPEGATCSPSKRIMSVTGPAEVGPADWDLADWQALRQELAAVARLAGELRLWTVLGSAHPLTPPHRPRRHQRPVGQLRHVRTAQRHRAVRDHRPGRPLGRAVPERRATRAGHRRHRQPAGVHRHRARQGPPVAPPGPRRSLRLAPGRRRPQRQPRRLLSSRRPRRHRTAPPDGACTFASEFGGGAGHAAHAPSCRANAQGCPPLDRSSCPVLRVR